MCTYELVAHVDSLSLHANKPMPSRIEYAIWGLSFMSFKNSLSRIVHCTIVALHMIRKRKTTCTVSATSKRAGNRLETHINRKIRVKKFIEISENIYWSKY